MRVLYDREQERGDGRHQERYHVMRGVAWNCYGEYIAVFRFGKLVPSNCFSVLGLRPLIRIKRLG